LGAGRKFSGTNEYTFRLVTFFFGTLLLLFFLMLKDGIGRSAVLFSILFAAVSPALVWYSRFYIHEMLLVCFSAGVIATVWRYLQSGKLVWMVIGGVFLGLMAGTKETWIIAAAAMICATAATAVWGSIDSKSSLFVNRIHLSACIAAFIAGIVVILLLYSSFYMNMGGVVDAVRSYGGYVKRGISGGVHEQPWYYYLWLLRYESAIVCLAVMGMLCVVFNIGMKLQYRRL